jgi:hypothetical protein
MLTNVFTPHFGGHQTFSLRHTWIPKAVPLVRADPQILFNLEETMACMGIGKNMAMSVRHWLESARIVEISTREDEKSIRVHHLTTEAQIMIEAEQEGSDVYLERFDSLWLIHWFLVSSSVKNALWTFVFNIFSQREFTRENLVEQVQRWCELNEHHVPSIKVLKNDIGTFLNMYCYTPVRSEKELQHSLSSPFKELDLISYSPIRGMYHLHRNSFGAISNDVVGFCILDYLHRNDWPSTVSFDELYYRPFSPGRVFQLSEEAMVKYLEIFSMMREHRYRFDTTAGVRQLINLGSSEVDKYSILKKIYS